jgi:hypothetical protein
VGELPVSLEERIREALMPGPDLLALAFRYQGWPLVDLSVHASPLLYGVG